MAVALGCVSMGAHKGEITGLTAIEHVVAIPMDGDDTIADATIVVEGERIVAVERGAANVPKNARHVDGRGLYAVPGFADMHTHPYDT